MTLSPPSLEDGRGKDDHKRDDDRHEKKRPNQDRDMDSTEVKGQSSRGAKGPGSGRTATTDRADARLSPRIPHRDRHHSATNHD